MDFFCLDRYSLSALLAGWKIIAFFSLFASVAWLSLWSLSCRRVRCPFCNKKPEAGPLRIGAWNLGIKWGGLKNLTECEECHFRFDGQLHSEGCELKLPKATEIECMNCGKLIGSTESRCNDCGWTWDT